MGKPRLPENSHVLISLLIFVRVSSAFYNIIYDCDETYNYWEIGHYLIYKVGYVTWEYSPLYALRSYYYLWTYLIPSFVLSFLVSNELILFYLTRVIIACFGIFCELYFCIGISRCAGTTVGRYSMAFSLISSGMFFASTAFLPNTLSMHLTMITFGAWFCDHYKRTIFAAGLAILIGWPYVAIVYIPIALSMLLIKKNKLYFVILTMIYATIILVPMIIVDLFYYGRFVIAPLNAVLYNVFNKNGGPELYGVESITYYPINLMLNFNLVFLASLCSVPMLILSKIFVTTRKHKMLESSHITCIVSLLLWLFIFSMQAHKEERFMYPIYPLICASAAFTVKLIEQFVVGPKRPYSQPVFKAIVYLCLLAFLSLSLSRVISLHQGYRGTFDVFSDLKHYHKTSGLKPILKNSLEKHENNHVEHYINVCYGKEWYRYPSSFFLPNSKQFRMRFIKSSFRGQLPKLFEPNEPGFKGMKTRIIFDDFNDMNKEEISRYIDPDKCHYLIDSSNVQNTSDHEPDYSSMTDKWKTISSHRMLDLSRSPIILRSFYIPYLSERQNTYVDFRLLRNDNLFLNVTSSEIKG